MLIEKVRDKLLNVIKVRTKNSEMTRTLFKRRNV